MIKGAIIFIQSLLRAGECPRVAENVAPAHAGLAGGADIILVPERTCNTEQLVAKIDEIDLRDGALDGRSAKTPPTQCDACGRTLAKRQPVCIYCGTDAESRDPFAR